MYRQVLHIIVEVWLFSAAFNRPTVGRDWMARGRPFHSLTELYKKVFWPWLHTLGTTWTRPKCTASGVVIRQMFGGCQGSNKQGAYDHSIFYIIMWCRPICHTRFSTGNQATCLNYTIQARSRTPSPKRNESVYCILARLKTSSVFFCLIRNTRKSMRNQNKAG